jgi:hypothetical protein
VLNGQKSTLDLCHKVHPQAIVPTSGAAELSYSGLLTKVLRLDGSLEEFQQLLSDEGINATVMKPQVGVPLEIPLTASPSLVV